MTISVKANLTILQISISRMNLLTFRKYSLIYHVNLNVAKVLRNLSNMHPKVIQEDFALKKPLKITYTVFSIF